MGMTLTSSMMDLLRLVQFISEVMQSNSSQCGQAQSRATEFLGYAVRPD